MPPHRSSRLRRRAVLRRWAALAASAGLALPGICPRQVAAATLASPAGQQDDASLTISSEAARLLVRFEAAAGRLLAASLTAYGTTWIPEAAATGLLSLEGV